MITIESLSFGYPGSGPLFDALDAAFEPGCISALAGPNGTGKSTLLKLVSGLLAPWSGEIRIGGVSVRKMDRIERAKRLAYMAQSPVLPEDWTVPEVLEAGDYPHRRRPPAPSSLEARLQSARKIMALDPFWERPVGTLSGGEAQRVALARALVQDAPLLVLDEPASHLDMRHQVQLYRSLHTLARNGR
ncbi:MAG: ABC transporter ATP-binding protein, partial [Acidobacteriota bacterium]